MTRQLRYRLTRPEHGKRKALSVDCATIQAAQRYARQRLSEAAEIIEVETLPLGCEAIARVGTIFLDGAVRWRRERRRKAARYLSDELTK